MKTLLPILFVALIPAIGIKAAILDVDLPRLIESVTVKDDDTLSSPGWIDSAMFTDFETTSVSDQMEEFRRIDDKVIPARDSLSLIPYDPWALPGNKLLQYATVFDDVNLDYRLASVLYKDGRPQKSIQVLEQALSSQDDETLTELYLGILVTENELKRAVEFAPDAVARFPESKILCFNAACAYAKMGETEEAMHYLGMVIQTDWPELIYLLNDADFDGIRSEPRFKNLQDALVFKLFSRVFSMPANLKSAPSI